MKNLPLLALISLLSACQVGIGPAYLAPGNTTGSSQNQASLAPAASAGTLTGTAPDNLVPSALPAAPDSSESNSLTVPDHNSRAGQLLKPSANTVLQAGETLELEVAWPGSDVARVVFQAGDTLLGEVAQAPFRLQWQAQDGMASQPITVIAYDRGGNEVGRIQPPVTLGVTPAPLQWVSTPNNDSFRLGSSLAFEVAFTGPTPPAEVRFLHGNQTLGTTRNQPYRWVWDTSSAGYGTYAVMAVAYDSQGNEIGRTPAAPSFNLTLNPDLPSQSGGSGNSGGGAAANTNERNNLDLIID